MTPLTSLFSALSRTRDSLSKALKSFTNKSADLGSMDALEASLLLSDMGIDTTEEILALTEKTNSENLIQVVSDYLIDILQTIESSPLPNDDLPPTVLLIVGVNGTGKTTSAAKLARFFKPHKNVLLVGADTYRAAAAEQLRVWANRADIRLVSNEASKDPSAIIFDGLTSAVANNSNMVIVDTAGRLHTYNHFMVELSKMNRVLDEHFPQFSKKSLITIDASLGQNSLHQAKVFSDHVDLDGAILTKMDGTAKGGIAFPLVRELSLPIRYVGTGEDLNDIEPFSGETYVKSILGIDRE